MGGSGLGRTDNFQKIADPDWIGFNFFGSGMDLDWKISQSTHLCFKPFKEAESLPGSI